MSEYWLISTPVERNTEEAWKSLYNSVGKLKNCEAYKFYVPTLKVGTLDSLLSDADDLSKLEMYLEGLLNRLTTGLINITDEHENILIDGLTKHNYLITFKWDIAKFSTKQPIRGIVDLVRKQAINFENDYKKNYQDYMNVSNAYEILEKNDQANLLTRNLHGLVKNHDLILNSEYLCTILIVIPRKLLNDWFRMYEHFDETVIPRSCRIIAEDLDFFLVGVTLFKSGVENFTNTAKRFKFVVREFVNDENELYLQKERMTDMKIKRAELYNPLLRSLKFSISEIFKNIIHIKSAKLFVESVLRYGLPADFWCALIVANKKYIKKLRDILYQLYKHLDATNSTDNDNKNLEAYAAIGHNPSDYFPYVSCKVSTDII